MSAEVLNRSVLSAMTFDPSSSTSSASMTMPACASTRCTSPTDAPGQPATFPSIAAEAASIGPHWTAEVYTRASEDAAYRARIAEAAKRLFHDLTAGFLVDPLIDLLYVKESWFSTEVLLHALCLVNRITARHPNWYAAAAHSSAAAADGAEAGEEESHPPKRQAWGSAGSNDPLMSSSLPRICSSTSSDQSTPKAEEADSSKQQLGSSSCSSVSVPSSNGSRLEVLTRSNCGRCFVALLLLSSKFHGDIVYTTKSIAKALNDLREAEKQRNATEETEHAASPQGSETQEAAAASSPSPPVSCKLQRMEPGRLGQCEQRMFKELNCTVWIHLPEYRCCETWIFQENIYS